MTTPKIKTKTKIDSALYWVLPILAVIVIAIMSAIPACMFVISRIGTAFTDWAYPKIYITIHK